MLYKDCFFCVTTTVQVYRSLIETPGTLHSNNLILKLNKKNCLQNDLMFSALILSSIFSPHSLELLFSLNDKFIEKVLVKSSKITGEITVGSIDQSWSAL